MQIERIYFESDQGIAKWLINDKSFKGKDAGRHKEAKFGVEIK